MTVSSHPLKSLFLVSALFGVACDTPPGDVGESANDTAASEGMPTTAGSEGSSSGGNGMPTTADPGGSSTSGTGDASVTDGMPTTADPGTSGTSATSGGTDSVGMPTTATTDVGSTGEDDSDSGESPVDDCSECGPGDVCVRHVALTAETFCVPMPDACGDGLDCECGAATLCNELYDTCIEPTEPNQLDCECSVCA
ncbi:MAG: hypothetical protein ACRBN8_32045 [Nannocystales bacterium]